ncbi:MAG: hypothetical protein FWF85_03695 [Clostridiales bacterium]|nr:hypothetical protein [Clostridiales bacterium]
MVDISKSRKPGWKLLLIAALLLLIAWLILLFSRGAAEKNFQPELYLEQSLAQTFQADSYGFRCRSVLYVGEEQRVFSLLEGQKASQETRHVKGSLLGTPVDIYLLERVLYQRDPLDGSWRKIEDIDSAAATLLLNELDPASNYHFIQLGETTYWGKEKLNGSLCRKIEFHPSLEDKWIERYFEQLTYVVWIDAKHPYLTKVQISGFSKENPDSRLIIEHEFFDFNKKIELVAPVVN